jgi:hypothetical protein
MAVFPVLVCRRHESNVQRCWVTPFTQTYPSGLPSPAASRKASRIREHGRGPSAMVEPLGRGRLARRRVNPAAAARPAAAAWPCRREARRRRWSFLPRAAGQRPRGALPGTHGTFGFPVRFVEKRARRPRSQGGGGRAPVGGEPPDAGGRRARGSLKSGRDARGPAARRGPGAQRVQVRVGLLQSGGRRQSSVNTQGASAGETPALPGGGGPTAVLGAVCSLLAGRAAS